MERLRHSVAKIAGGTLAGQAAGLLAAPLIARLFDPTWFGFFASLSAVAAVIGAVAAARFDLVIPLPDRDRDAHAAVGLALTASLCTGALCAVVLGVYYLLSRPSPAAFVVNALLACVSVTAIAGSLTLNQLAIRQGRFSAVARRNLVQPLFLVCAQLTCGALGWERTGLMVGFVIGQSLGFISLLIGANLWSIRQQIFAWRVQMRVARRYRRFSALMIPSGILNSLGQQLPVLLFAAHYSVTAAGWMGLTQRVLATPVTLVGTAVAQVYLGRVAKLVHEDIRSAQEVFNRASRALIMVATPIVVAITILGPWAFSFVFGHQWIESGVFAQAMSLSLGAQIVAAPLSQNLIVLERPGMQVSWDAARVVLVVLAVSAAALLGARATQAVWVLAGVSAVMYVLLWCLNHKALSEAVRRSPSAE